ncbi:MAG: type II toxin-antitoxin system RelE/ParE family toxin [Chloroflexi bacterium]|nr:type II toxin-antitoxin system RelE/ParE family toxin [Chloroflexota bacterium]
MYNLIIPDAVAKDVKRLDRPVQRKLRDVHSPCLKENPHTGEQLRGALNGIWSYHFKFRTTQYRIANEILDQEQEVLLVMIGKRGDFYEALLRRVGLW